LPLLPKPLPVPDSEVGYGDEKRTWVEPYVRHDGSHVEGYWRNTSPAQHQEYMSLQGLRTRWAHLDLDLLPYAGQPNAPEARRIIEEQKAVTKLIHHHHLDEGGPEGIGLPGGPRDVVVVGAGPAGLSAAIYGGTQGLDTLLVESTHRAGGQAGLSSRIENFLGFPAGITGRQLAEMGLEQAQRTGADTELGVRVTGLRYDPETHLKHLTLSNGEEVTSRAVIIAGGVQFRRLDFPGSDSPDVVYGNSATVKRRCRGRDVVIIGAGNAAAQAAVDAATAANHVTILVRHGTVRGQTSNYMADQLENHPKVTILPDTEIASAALDADRRVRSITTKDGRTIEAGAVGIFVGSAPETDWAAGIERDERGYIKTGGDGADPLETNIPGVFAAGDVRANSIHRVITAAADGSAAISSTHEYMQSLIARSEPKAATVFERLADEIPDDEADRWMNRIDALDRDQPFTGGDNFEAVEDGRWIKAAWQEARHPRDDHGRFAHEDHVLAPFAARAIDLVNKNGGFSFTSDGNLADGNSYFSAVEGHEERFPRAELTPERIMRYHDANRDLLQSDPSLLMGGWCDKKSGDCYLDLSKALPDAESARRFALDNHQLAVWDGVHGKEIRLTKQLTVDQQAEKLRAMHENIIHVPVLGQKGTFDEVEHPRIDRGPHGGEFRPKHGEVFGRFNFPKSEDMPWIGAPGPPAPKLPDDWGRPLRKGDRVRRSGNSGSAGIIARITDDDVLVKTDVPRQTFRVNSAKPSGPLIPEDHEYTRMGLEQIERTLTHEEMDTARAPMLTWAKKYYPHITWDMDRMSPFLMEKVLRQFHKLAQDYPIVVRDRFKQMTSSDSTRGYFSRREHRNTWAHASNGIQFNPNWWDERRRTALERALERTSQPEQSFRGSTPDRPGSGWRTVAGWHPIGADNPESVVTHEFGHMLDFWLGAPDYRAGQMYAPGRNPAVTSIVRADGMGLVASSWSKFKENTHPQQLSQYARKNKDERIAEGFSALYHTPPEHQGRWLDRLDFVLTELANPNKWTREWGEYRGASAEEKAAYDKWEKNFRRNAGLYSREKETERNGTWYRDQESAWWEWYETAFDEKRRLPDFNEHLHPRYPPGHPHAGEFMNKPDAERYLAALHQSGRASAPQRNYLEKLRGGGAGARAERITQETGAARLGSTEDLSKLGIPPELIEGIRKRGLDDDLKRRKKGATAKKLLGRFEDTKQLHTDPKTGAYSQDRKKLHDAIIDSFLREKKPVFNGKFVEWVPDAEGEYVTTPAKTRESVRKRLGAIEKQLAGDAENPELLALQEALKAKLDNHSSEKRALFLAGGNASGKSTALYSPENAALMKPDSTNVEINFDLIKERLPEFQAMAQAHDIYGTDGTHFESADIARRLLDEANERGLNVIVDASGNSSKPGFRKQLEAHSEKGYQTDVLMVDAPIDIALRDSVSRATKTGRYIPAPVLRRVHKNSVKNHLDWRDGSYVNSWQMYRRDDNGVVKAAEGGKGKTKVLDKAAYDAVLSKAEGKLGHVGKAIRRWLKAIAEGVVPIDAWQIRNTEVEDVGYWGGDDPPTYTDGDEEAEARILQQTNQVSHVGQLPAGEKGRVYVKPYSRHDGTRVDGYWRETLEAIGAADALPKAPEGFVSGVRQIQRLTWGVQADSVHPSEGVTIERLRGATHPDPHGPLAKFEAEQQKLLSALVADKAVQVRVPLYRLPEIVESGGLKNQWVTGESEGWLASQKSDKDRRKSMEEGILGVPYDAPPRARPIYGYLEGSGEHDDGAIQYGGVRLALKPEVRKRTTFTFGDSLDKNFGGLVPTVAPSPLDAPELQSLDGYTLLEKTALKDLYMRYAETQTYGGVKLSDIDHIDIDKRLWESAEFDVREAVASLKKAGVAVRFVRLGTTNVEEQTRYGPAALPKDPYKWYEQEFGTKRRVYVHPYRHEDGTAVAGHWRVLNPIAPEMLNDDQLRRISQIINQAISYSWARPHIYSHNGRVIAVVKDEIHAMNHESKPGYDETLTQLARAALEKSDKLGSTVEIDPRLVDVHQEVPPKGAFPLERDGEKNDALDLLANYSEFSAEPINSRLREFQETDLRPGSDEAALEHFIDRSPLKKPLTVWRGINSSAGWESIFGREAFPMPDPAHPGSGVELPHDHLELKKFGEAAVGRTIHDYGFTSTTTNFDTAQAFAGKKTGHSGVVLEFLLPPGTPALKNTTRTDEKEWLLQHNRSYRIIRSRLEVTKSIYDADVPQLVLTVEPISKPEVLPVEGFDRKVFERGTPVYYHGIHGEDSKVAAQAFREGAVGSGMNGKGIYLGRYPATAVGYAQSYSGDTRGVVMRASLSPSAKIATEETIPRDERYPESPIRQADWAKEHGFDVYDNGITPVVVNPDVLTWDERNYDIHEASDPAFERRSWAWFPFSQVTGQRPNERDTAPERTDEGDFILYHGTSPQGAEAITSERRVKPDDLGAVGVTTRPGAAQVFSAMKHGSVLKLVIDMKWLRRQTAIREIGGSGRDQWLLQASYANANPKAWSGIPPEALKSVEPYDFEKAVGLKRRVWVDPHEREGFHVVGYWRNVDDLVGAKPTKEFPWVGAPDPPAPEPGQTAFQYNRVIARWRKEHYGKNSVRLYFERIEPQLAYRLATQFHRLAQEYPAVIAPPGDTVHGLRWIGIASGRREEMLHGKGRGERIYAHYSRLGEGIELNERWFPKLHDDRSLAARGMRGLTVDESLSSGVASHYHPPGSDSAESLLTHEFGHAVDAFLNEHPSTQIDWGHLKADWQRRTILPRPSAYARKNSQELVAESFAALHHAPNLSAQDMVIPRELGDNLRRYARVLNPARYAPASGKGLGAIA
jgi:thioredoxin reductase